MNNLRRLNYKNRMASSLMNYIPELVKKIVDGAKDKIMSLFRSSKIENYS